jgi:hypothetical protein
VGSPNFYKSYARPRIDRHMGLQNQSCRRPAYLLFVAVIAALSPQVVRAVLFDPNCDPFYIECRHQQDPEQDDVEGGDNIFIHASFAPTTISVPPTVFPTLLTITASPTATAAPTSSPPPTRTSAPSLPFCNLDDSGFYGDDSGTSQLVEMEFNYQVQVTPGTTFVTVSNDVLPSVENAIVANLLPSIFPCSSERRRLLRLLQSSLTGISAQPRDLILSGGECIVNNCCQTIPR